MSAWRGVEDQYVAATMRLVDSSDEHEVLERLIEDSKPPAPTTRAPKHYLLFTPFRYRPPRASRFRRAGALGIWYGAEDLQAACAEVAYWRHRFMLDSAGLAKSVLLTEYTFIQAQVSGTAIDLTSAPWVAASASWTHDSDYTETHAVADQARARGVQWIRYASVRAPSKKCAAVLDLEALQAGDLEKTKQNWHCKASRDAVMFINGSQRFDWTF
ncbi:MAG: RES family NAD+ phosphorylase [Pseudomonadota bacterium]